MGMHWVTLCLPHAWTRQRRSMLAACQVSIVWCVCAATACGSPMVRRHPLCFPDEPQRSVRGMLAGLRVWKGTFNEAGASPAQRHRPRHSSGRRGAVMRDMTDCWCATLVTLSSVERWFSVFCFNCAWQRSYVSMSDIFLPFVSRVAVLIRGTLY